MSSGRKSIGTYYAKAVATTILTCAFFRFEPIRGRRRSSRTAMILPCAISRERLCRFLPTWGRLPAPELAPRRCTTRGSATRTLVLVPEDQPAFLQVIGRHL